MCKADRPPDYAGFPYRNGPKPVMGLIGAIGAGKTAAATALQARGGKIINADRLGHEGLENPVIRSQLIDRWGSRIVREDGTLDRRAIATIVFADSHERSALEQLLFPYIRRRASEEIARAQTEPGIPFIVLDAAVLLEAGWHEVCDTIVYIDAPRDLRLQRLAARSGWSEADLAARECAQWPAVDKISHADVVIENAGSLEQLQERIDDVLRLWHYLDHSNGSHECPCGSESGA